MTRQRMYILNVNSTWDDDDRAIGKEAECYDIPRDNMEITAKKRRDVACGRPWVYCSTRCKPATVGRYLRRCAVNVKYRWAVKEVSDAR